MSIQEPWGEYTWVACLQGEDGGNFECCRGWQAGWLRGAVGVGRGMTISRGMVYQIPLPGNQSGGKHTTTFRDLANTLPCKRKVYRSAERIMAQEFGEMFAIAHNRYWNGVAKRGMGSFSRIQFTSSC